ncbi:conserved hypothetical protein [Ricinus communis]|uniref:ATPase AAA-type core domain-containing protein n=1 Tax=Ricinus communis TaxID=3988 RepID=B9T674_RICCO|nr:conserved hypothetical protein [Ricinus communis]
MFVGVGPSKMRNLFQEARQCAPSIILIDEIGRGGSSQVPKIAGGTDIANVCNEAAVIVAKE